MKETRKKAICYGDPFIFIFHLFLRLHHFEPSSKFVGTFSTGFFIIWNFPIDFFKPSVGKYNQWHDLCRLVSQNNRCATAAQPCRARRVLHSRNVYPTRRTRPARICTRFVIVSVLFQYPPFGTRRRLNRSSRSSRISAISTTSSSLPALVILTRSCIKVVRLSV